MEINKDEPVIVGSGVDAEVDQIVDNIDFKAATEEVDLDGPRVLVQMMTGKDIIGKLREEMGVRADGKGFTSDS